jgi:hypothetical protein
MSTEWRNFLTSRGARFEGDTVQDFGDPNEEAEAAIAGSVVTDLSFLSVVKISGANAATVLSGRLTCEVERLTDGAPQLGACCNSKGAVIANFIIARLGVDFFVVLPEEMRAAFLHHCGRLLSRANVTLEDCSRTLPCIGYRQEDGDRLSGAALAHRLRNQQRAIRMNGLVMLHLPVNWNRVIIFGPPSALEVAWLNLVQIYGTTGSRYWQLFDVLDGLPWILNATTEALQPQCLDLDPFQALDLDKRSIPGPETTTPLDHQTPRQRLFIAILEANSPIPPGTKLYTSAKADSIGLVINVSTHPTLGLHALAALDVDYGDLGELRLENDPVRIRRIMAPPYRAELGDLSS